MYDVYIDRKLQTGRETFCLTRWGRPGFLYGVPYEKSILFDPIFDEISRVVWYQYKRRICMDEKKARNVLSRVLQYLDLIM